MLQLLVLLIAACGLWPAAALAQNPRQGPRTPKPEELKQLVARRIQRQTGIPVRIADLIYNPFNSTFSGKKIEAGPRAAPLLSLAQIKLKIVLLPSRPGISVANIEARGLRLRIPASWLGRRSIELRSYRRVSLRRGNLSNARVQVWGGSKGALATLEGVQLSVSKVSVPALRKGRPIRLSGGIWLTAKRLVSDGLVLSGIALQGSLAGSRLQVKQLAARLLGGPMLLSGHVGLPGEVDLAGKVKLRPWGAAGPTLEGPVRLRGKSLDRLTLSGKLSASGPVLKQHGRGTGPLPVKLRVKLGRRWLKGRLSRWRIR